MIVLSEVIVKKYKSFYTPQHIPIEIGSTCLIGLNETGKTSFLEVLAKTNYFSGDSDFKFDINNDYPRRDLVRFQKSEGDSDAVECIYTITEPLLKEIEEELGEGVLPKTNFSVSYKYKAAKGYITEFTSDFKAFLRFKMAGYKINPTNVSEIEEAASLEDVLKIDDIGLDKEFNKLKNDILLVFKEAFDTPNKLDGYIAKKWLLVYLPKFWYYDNNYTLDGRISINDLRNPPLGYIEKVKTAKALFELANIDINELLSTTEYEQFAILLEAFANEMSEKIFQYWTTNKHLDIDLKIETVTAMNQKMGKVVSDKVLDIRVRSQRQRVSLPLNKRSKGFLWFLSFVIWFTKIQNDKKNRYILLFDEPALHLHPHAQVDVLRFIKEMSKDFQIIYTTHSPYMIDHENLKSIRTVTEADEGSIFSNAFEEKDEITLAPIRAALGHHISQKLDPTTNTLFVSSPSDVLWLTAMSEIVKADNRKGLNPSIVITPIGSLDRVLTYEALVRNKELDSNESVEFVALFPGMESTKEQADVLLARDSSKKKNIRFYNEFIDNKLATAGVEDLMTSDEFMQLCIDAYPENKRLALREFDFKYESIAHQAEYYFNKTEPFSSYHVAYWFMHSIYGKEFFCTDTILRFEKLFITINRLFKN